MLQVVSQVWCSPTRCGRKTRSSLVLQVVWQAWCSPTRCGRKPRLMMNPRVAGRFTIPAFAAYSMSKKACIAFSDALRLEMKKFDVAVITIEPGLYRYKPLLLMLVPLVVVVVVGGGGGGGLCGIVAVVAIAISGFDAFSGATDSGGNRTLRQGSKITFSHPCLYRTSSNRLPFSVFCLRAPIIHYTLFYSKGPRPPVSLTSSLLISISERSSCRRSTW